MKTNGILSNERIFGLVWFETDIVHLDFILFLFSTVGASVYVETIVDVDSSLPDHMNNA